MKNDILHKAKEERYDEYYTRYQDIEEELKYYWKFFKDKVIYCNCDDYSKSNFVKYFVDNFTEIGLKKLIATCYTKDGKGKYFEFNGQNKIVYNLDSDGDFRSVECKKILEEADIVITNPPFSLFRNFVAQLMEYNKKFLIIGNMNAITYKEIFPLIKENKLWLGLHLCKQFIQPNGEMKKFGNICWFTNLEHDKRKIPLDLYRNYSEEYFPKYDNYNAIEVSKVCDIPIDFQDVMAVPITFIDKYCPSQFEILDLANAYLLFDIFGVNQKVKEQHSHCCNINGKATYARILIRKKK